MPDQWFNGFQPLGWKFHAHRTLSLGCLFTISLVSECVTDISYKSKFLCLTWWCFCIPNCQTGGHLWRDLCHIYKGSGSTGLKQVEKLGVAPKIPKPPRLTQPLVSKVLGKKTFGSHWISSPRLKCLWKYICCLQKLWDLHTHAHEHPH